MQYTILVVDDEKSQRELLAGFLKNSGYKVFSASDGNQALDLIKSNVIDIMISDYKMGEMSGLDLLKEIKKINPEITFIMITAHGTVENAVKAMKEGAYDYLTKPVELDELEILIRRVIERNALISEVKNLKQQLASQNKLTGIISNSVKMQAILDVASRVSESKASVLIQGESGTGKEVLARAIHFSSSRKDSPFVAVNCAALNENLLESELFGHEKGAFTGADKQRRGRFETANSGTIFLDEIGDLPLTTQIKLLRVLQEGEIERVGGNQTIKIDVRVIAATNKNIEELIRQEKFREDLFYRINVVNIKIPPLRERKEDIIYLISYFINKYISETKKEKAEFSREAVDVLMKYNYPGNVRELENIVHHSLVLARNELITVNDLPVELRGLKSEENIGDLIKGDSTNLNEIVESVEKKLVREALAKTNGNQSKAAKLLGISERNLRYRLEKWGDK